MKKTAQIFSLGAANGIIYGLNAFYYCFIQIYISKYHPENITGVLLSIGPLVAIFAPMLWGNFADRAKSKNIVLAIAVIGSAAAFMAVGRGQSFWYLAITLAVTMLFMSPFGGLVDIITLEYSSESGVKYGPIRICGVLCFGLFPFIFAPLAEENINIIFYAYLIFAVICALSVLFSPKISGHGTKEKRPSVLPIFKDKALMLIFLFVTLSQFSWAYYLNYFPGHLTGDLGVSQSIWGINVFITVLGEIPFFLMFNFFFDKVGIKKLLFISLLLSSLRYIGLAFLTNVPLLLGVGLLTGFAVTVFTYCGSVYINRNIPPESKASANSLMYSICNGVPKVLAGAIGGSMTATIGYTASMMICALLCTASLVVFLFTRKRFD